MLDQASKTTRRTPRPRRKPLTLRHWTNGLLAAVVGVFALDAGLVIARGGPAWLLWALLGVACGLLTLVWLLEAGRAIWQRTGPALAAWRQSRRTTEGWAQAWEELMQKPLH